MIERIAILGTGLLGASIGLSLRAAGYRGQITGWNRSAEGGQTALAAGAVDELAGDPLEAARAEVAQAEEDWLELETRREALAAGAG